MNKSLDSEFPQNENIIYINHAAVSPWPLRTAQAVQEFANENLTQGATAYDRWMEKEKQLRRQLKTLLNAPSTQDIAFVKNTSEALSFVAHGFPWKSGDNVIVTDQEFPSNRIVWEALAPRGVTVRTVSLTGNAEQNIIDAIDERTRLLSVSSVQYATGFRLDLPTLGAACHDRGVALCVDAIQSLGVFALDVIKCKIDFVMADAHKWLMGPEGIGVFYCSESWREKLALHEHGWRMIEHPGDYDKKQWQPARSARRFECGSPNFTGIFALSASLSLIEEVGVDTISQRGLEHTAYLLDELSKWSVDIISATLPQRRSPIVTFSPPGVDCEKLALRLRRRNVVCAYRGGGVRFSPHFYNTRAQLRRALEILDEEMQTRVC